MEIWKDIEGYEKLYQISNLGRVKSLSREKRCGSVYYITKEKVLRTTTNKKGYLKISLHKDKVIKTYYIHRLVAETFIPNLDNLPQVNHKDENKSNNCVNNLEWCTNEYNHRYGTINKRISNSNKGKVIKNETRVKISNKNKGKKMGGKNPMARSILCITTNEKFNSIADASRKYNIDSSAIVKSCRNKCKSAGKHLMTGEKLYWKYVKESENEQRNVKS